MRRLRFLSCLVLGLWGAGCGDDDAATACGDGTALVDGSCVPAEEACASGTTYNSETRMCDPDGGGCGDGTIEVAGECFPDDICEAGTTFDATTRRCALDSSACGEGTMIVEGECVPVDDGFPTPDVMEASENNDPTFGGMPATVNIPDEGSSVTLGGCVEPVSIFGDDAVEPDQDGFVITLTEPTLLNIKVAGSGGMVGGFVLLPAGGSGLARAGWRRLGANVTDVVVDRNVFVPAEGEYLLLIADGRGLVLNEAAGGPDRCYFAEISRQAIPAATPIELDTETRGTLGPDPMFYSFSTDSEIDIQAILRLQSNPRNEGLDLALFSPSSRSYDRSDRAGDPGSFGINFSLGADEELTLVVDSRLRLTLVRPMFSIEVVDQASLMAR